MADLRRRLQHLKGRVARIERRTTRFDAWESCLSWMPVTEAGDHDQNLGYLRRARSSDEVRHDTGIDLDTSEWDDPDYQLMAFVGENRPFGSRECNTEPGEGFDGLPPRASDARAAHAAMGRHGPMAELRRGTVDLQEDLEDLDEPVGDITRFDECMYTVGVQARGRYVFQGPGGRRRLRPVLSFDMRGHHLPQLDLMAFPGEEPPQIECNEDAGGQDTEE